MFLLFTVAAFLLAYAALISFYAWHWMRTREWTQFPDALEPVSIVVAARNEEQALPRLLESIAQQHYPPELNEVIIVDDYSTDATRKAIEPFLNGRVRCLSPAAEARSSSKKQAIGAGVRNASHGLILVTDADCVVPPEW